MWREHRKLFHKKSSKKCFKQRQHRWAKSVAAQRGYFEGDPTQ
jgi:hypothetical protein